VNPPLQEYPSGAVHWFSFEQNGVSPSKKMESDMLAQFSIWPLDDPHMSSDLARVAEMLDRMGSKYQLGPMGTTIEGSWPEVMKAIEACHQQVRDSHDRVLTTITIDDDSTRSQNLAEPAAKVAAERESTAS
jgi:uncharacterized protein (TIGR00106 family)